MQKDNRLFVQRDDLPPFCQKEEDKDRLNPCNEHKHWEKLDQRPKFLSRKKKAQ